VSWEQDDGGVDDIYAGLSYLSGASGTLDWTLGSAATWHMIGVALLEAIGGGGGGPLPFRSSVTCVRVR
jgi:hypothetical protein